MNAIRQIHENLAEMIQVPEEFRHRKTEVIFIAIEDSDSQADQTFLSRFYGAIPDFPNRDEQGVASELLYRASKSQRKQETLARIYEFLACFRIYDFDLAAASRSFLAASLLGNWSARDVRAAGQKKTQLVVELRLG